jgi:sporulation protein YlmC with PRC-barrel domain
MSHYGVLGDYQFKEAAEDIRGTTLYGAEDEKLGKIGDVIFDHSSGNVRYVVVDTGGWLTTKKFIVPADRLSASTEHKGDFASGLTKKLVESFPPYNESDLKSDDKWADYEGRYRSKWETGPVMRRAETDRNITPTTEQLQGNPVSISAERGATRPLGVGNTSVENIDDKAASGRTADADTGRVVPAGTDSVIIDNSAVGIGGRWDTFQARLRERRKEVVAGCTTCSVGPAASKGSEGADTLKKAG